MDKRKILAKYAKKFACLGVNREILGGIHYAADGSAVVTNREYLLRIRDVHNLPQPTTIHVTVGTPLEGKYPDTSKVFPTSFAGEMRLGVPVDVTTRLSCAAAAATTLDKKTPLLRLEEKNGSVHAVAADRDRLVECKAFLGNTVQAAVTTRTLNANYLLTALQVFKDAGGACIVRWNKPLEPIVLTDDEHIDVLILPYRVSD